MISKSLERLRLNPGIVPIVDTAMGTLIQAGVVTFLRERGVPAITDGGESINKSAIAAAISAGYNACLDDLLNFKERFIAVREHKQTSTPDYGATEAALQSGDLSEEELNAIRSNKQFSPKEHVSSAKQDFAEFSRKRAEHNAKLAANPTNTTK